MSHQHRRPNYCVCNAQALEPDESCPIHGAGEWPPRCVECGQFMRYIKSEQRFTASDGPTKAQAE